VKTRERSISIEQVSRSKAFEVPRMASPFDFGLEHKNIILVALLDFEFSHSLGPACVKTQKLEAPQERNSSVRFQY
jgi:hypothetical protein